MPTRLYLDTARLGLMSRGAQQIYIDFIRFAGEEGGSLYLDRFLRTGIRGWPQSLQRRFPALRAWNGISHLKEGLKDLAEAPTDWQVLLANRSAHLMRIAAGLLFRLCRNVLVTDLTWPSYRLILQRVRRLSGNRLTEVSLRSRILRHAVAEDEVVDEIVRCYLTNG